MLISLTWEFTIWGFEISHINFSYLRAFCSWDTDPEFDASFPYWLFGLNILNIGAALLWLLLLPVAQAAMEIPQTTLGWASTAHFLLKTPAIHPRARTLALVQGFTPELSFRCVFCREFWLIPLRAALALGWAVSGAGAEQNSFQNTRLAPLHHRSLRKLLQANQSETPGPEIPASGTLSIFPGWELTGSEVLSSIQISGFVNDFEATLQGYLCWISRSPAFPHPENRARCV